MLEYNIAIKCPKVEEIKMYVLFRTIYCFALYGVAKMKGVRQI